MSSVKPWPSSSVCKISPQGTFLRNLSMQLYHQGLQIHQLHSSAGGIWGSVKPCSAASHSAHLRTSVARSPYSEHAMTQQLAHNPQGVRQARHGSVAVNESHGGADNGSSKVHVRSVEAIISSTMANFKGRRKAASSTGPANVTAARQGSASAAKAQLDNGQSSAAKLQPTSNSRDAEGEGYLQQGRDRLRWQTNDKSYSVQRTAGRVERGPGRERSAGRAEKGPGREWSAGKTQAVLDNDGSTGRQGKPVGSERSAGRAERGPYQERSAGLGRERMAEGAGTYQDRKRSSPRARWGGAEGNGVHEGKPLNRKQRRAIMMQERMAERAARKAGKQESRQDATSGAPNPRSGPSGRARGGSSRRPYDGNTAEERWSPESRVAGRQRSHASMGGGGSNSRERSTEGPHGLHVASDRYQQRAAVPVSVDNNMAARGSTADRHSTDRFADLLDDDSFPYTRHEREAPSEHWHDDVGGRALGRAPVGGAPQVTQVPRRPGVTDGAWDKADQVAVAEALQDARKLADRKALAHGLVVLGSTDEELRRIAEQVGGGEAYRGKQLLDGVLRGAKSLDAINNIPKAMKQQLQQAGVRSGRSKIHHRVTSADGTRKFLLQLYDGFLVETVGIPQDDEGKQRLTVCVSSQVGCPMRCTFCATGKGGYARNLAPYEIVDQVLTVQEEFDCRVSNVVFMGQGEPLLNYGSVIRAVEVLNKDLGIGQRKITVSTVGVPNAIAKVAACQLQCTLAVSIHAPTQRLRETIVPSAKAYPLPELLNDCAEYFKRTGRRVTFEYTLLSGVNDSQREAEQLAALLKANDLRGHVNLIPWNAVDDSEFKRPSNGTINRFKKVLEMEGVPVSVRVTRGLEAAAACGQLRNAYQKQPLADFQALT